jgi:hypothetical protein
VATIDSPRAAAPEVAVVVAEPRAIISWSSILAGALIAVAVLFLLSVTALAAGLEVAPLADAGDPMLGPVASAIVTGLFIVIAFGAGGLTAVWAAGIVEPGPAVLHGFLVWALALMLMLALVAFGLGGFGATTTFLGPAFEASSVEDFEDAAWVLGRARRGPRNPRGDQSRLVAPRGGSGTGNKKPARSGPVSFVRRWRRRSDSNR